MKPTTEISIDQIKPNRYQPRIDFNPDALFELAQSIRENGLIQPITVRKDDQFYEIITGERRYRAMMLAGFTSIPCIVVEATTSQLAQMALIENIQREDLSAIEEAKAYLQLMKDNGLTQEKVAQAMGKSQSAIANKIRLLNLPLSIQDGVNTKLISERHARALLGLDQQKQLEVFESIKRQQLTVKQTEQLVEKVSQKEKPKAKIVTKVVARHVMIAKNTISQAIAMIAKSGIAVDSEEVENEDEIQIIIKLKKAGR